MAIPCDFVHIQICTERSHSTDFEFVLDNEEIPEFEDDMVNGSYEKWIEKYPNILVSVFSEYLKVCENIKSEDIKIFKKKGIELDCTDDLYTCGDGSTTPLCMACECGNYEAIKALLENGANPNLRGTDGYSPLEYLLMCNETHSDIQILVELLLSYNIDNIIYDNAKVVIEDNSKDTSNFDYISKIIKTLSVISLNLEECE